MRLSLFAFLIISTCACNNTNTSSIDVPQKTDTIHAVQEKILFFPVSDYIGGQIMNIIKNKTPIKKYTIKGGHIDSVKVKIGDFKNLVNEFLVPEIDSVNLVPFFTESKFLDQTIDAFTFSYDAKPKLPDSILLRHWDVYVEPGSGNVKRIYLVKKINEDKQLQLTWQSNKWCKITTILNSPSGASTVEKEEKISWEF